MTTVTMSLSCFASHAVEPAVPVVLPEQSVLSSVICPMISDEIMGYIAEDRPCVDRFVTLRPDLEYQEYQIFSSSS